MAARIFCFRYGLVSQVVTLVVATVVVVGGLISMMMAQQSQSTLRQQIIANNLAATELAAEFAFNYVDSAQISVRLLARSPFVEESVLDKAFSDTTAELQKLLRLNRQLDGCSVFDDHGVSRATGDVSANKVGNYSGDRDWFQQTMATGQPSLGIPVISRGTGRPVIPYAVPVLDPKGKVKGIVICGISLASLSDAIAAYQTGPGARAALIDRRLNGIILAHPDRKRILTAVTGRDQAVNELLRGARGAMETEDSSGAINLAVYAPVPHLPWGVLILQPRKIAFAPVTKAARQSASFTALLLLLTAALSGLLARRVTRPLLRLRNAAGRLADGDLTARLNFTRQDEVGDLGRAFDQMAIALAQRSSQLRAANEELKSEYLQVQDANRLKSEFLANMSHELRTPLNAIIGFAQLMHDGKVGAISDDQREYLNDILTSADHLLQLINDVLDLSRVESGKLEFNPEPIDLKKLIAEVSTVLQPLSASKRLTVDLFVDSEIGQVVLDSAKLKQVLYNYLSNAIKFTAEEGQILVRGRMEDAEHFRLEVEDTGIGIMPEELDKLFVAFQQLDSSAGKKYQGTGLGLALTKRIVEAQGGRVGVRSARGKGSVFYAVLPTRADVIQRLTNKIIPAPATSADAPNVLVIEDSEPDRKWLTQILIEAGYRAETANNGAEAAEKAHSRAYAAILLDLILPDTGGWDILHAIRAVGPNQHTPVIVVTVVAEQGVAKGFPIQDYLVKPVRPNALLDALRAAGVTPKSPRRKILVVDDDAKTLKLAAVGLKAGGYEVVCHSSSISALRDANLKGFGAVVLDLLM
ncbi:MAG: ATP-binding protein, partial [Chloroflexota bacterium]